MVNEDALQLVTILESAFDAIDKGYLKGVVLSIYSAEENEEDRELLESYVFNVKYGSAGDTTVGLTVSTDKDAFTMPRVRGEAIQLIRSLIRTCESMKPIHDDRVLTLRLFYYDDVTPADYQPGAGGDFSDATHDRVAFFKSPPLMLPVGKVNTQTLSFTVRAAWKEDDEYGDTHLEEAGGAGASASAEGGGAGVGSGAGPGGGGGGRVVPYASAVARPRRR